MSVPPSRQSAFATAPMPDLLDILLRQIKRPLATYGIDLTAADITAIVQGIIDRQPPDEKARQVREGLARAVRESESVLARWDFTFQQALQTDMENVPGWHTTAEFLEVANEKSNAELRIAVGSALLLALGDDTYASYLRFLDENPTLDEVSAIMARRVLAFADA